jgi:hypothetical protein
MKQCLHCNKEIHRRQYRLKKDNNFCNMSCHKSYQRIQTDIRNTALLIAGKLKHRDIIKRTLFSMGVENKCQICGISEWMGKPLTMILDHINGRANNNLPENLRLICHNCDSQTDHYKGRNKGNGRKSLGLI